ncbi:MAG TPA: hypothetical protein VMV95_00975 [Bacillota bacterium]|nr:hypothetical protein [Bacillota bacterium]
MKLKMFVEEWLMTIEQGKHKGIEIFVNPSSRELLEIVKRNGKSIRAIVSPLDSKIYVFPAYILHTYVAYEVDKEKNTELIKDYSGPRKESKNIYVEGKIEGGKIIVFKGSNYKKIKELKMKEADRIFSEPRKYK